MKKGTGEEKPLFNPFRSVKVGAQIELAIVSEGLPLTHCLRSTHKGQTLYRVNSIYTAQE